MNTVLSVVSKTPLYKNDGVLWKFKDRIKISYEGISFIKELNISVAKVSIPSNIYIKAYNNNIKTAKHITRADKIQLAPNIWRILDYNKFSEYQKRLFAFSVVRSIKLFLSLNGKNINNSCIVVTDAKDEINFYIIEELSKVSKYIVLLSKDINGLKKVRDSIIYNYGVTPIITREYDYAVKNADFIICSRDIDPIGDEKNIWYINDRYMPKNQHNLDINNVLYKVPWDMKGIEANVQNLGAILKYIGSNDVEKDLKYNGICIEEFGFNI